MNPTPRHVIVFDFATADFDRTKEVSREHLQDALRRGSGNPKVTVKHLETAMELRRGRVLLAGDSAHIHSPLGAQGLNTGLGDAFNLGWKLAAAVRHPHSPTAQSVLESYSAERLPVAAAVLAWSRAQVSIMRPTLHSKACKELIKALINTTDGTNYFIDRVWGLSTPRYDVTTQAVALAASASAPAPDTQSHPLLGCSVPDFTFADGSRLGQLLAQLGPSSGLLLELSAAPDASLRLQAAAEHTGGPVAYQCAQPQQSVARSLRALLIRPDGFVAWVATAPQQQQEHERSEQQVHSSEQQLQELQQAMHRWFGITRTPSVSQ